MQKLTDLAHPILKKYNVFTRVTTTLFQPIELIQ